VLLSSSQSRCLKQFELAHCGQRTADPGLELRGGVRSTNTPCSRTLVACYLSFLFLYIVCVLPHLYLLRSSCLTLFFLSRFLLRRLSFAVSGRRVKEFCSPNGTAHPQAIGKSKGLPRTGHEGPERE